MTELRTLLKPQSTQAENDTTDPMNTDGLTKDNNQGRPPASRTESLHDDAGEHVDEGYASGEERGANDDDWEWV